MKRAGMAWAQDSSRVTLKNSSTAAKAAKRSIVPCGERETTAISPCKLDLVLTIPWVWDA